MAIKRLFLLAAGAAFIAASISSCASRFGNPEEPVMDVPVFNVPGDSVTFTIEANIIPDEVTRTSLDANGHSVNWTSGDKIHVLYLKTNDTKAVAESSLLEGAGTPNGIFMVTFSSFKTLLGAYYDEAGSSNVSQTNKVWYATTTLSPEQTQASGMNSLSGCDIKLAETFIAGMQGGNFQINFKQKNTLLNFDIKPTAEMVSDGQKIRKVTLEAQHYIAGEFKLPVEFDKIGNATSSTGNSRNAVTTTISGDIPFTSGSTVNVRMYVLPSIKKGDTFTITVYTDDYTVTVSGVKAAKNYEAGYRYHMNLDLPALVSSGKAVVVKKNRLLELSECGIWNCQNLSSIFSVSDGMQYGYSSTKFRMVVPATNWEDYKVVFIEHPSTMSVGSTYSITISHIGDTGVSLTGQRSVKLLKLENGKYWLEDTSDPSIGYIIMSK